MAVSILCIIIHAIKRNYKISLSTEKIYMGIASVVMSFRVEIRLKSSQNRKCSSKAFSRQLSIRKCHFYVFPNCKFMTLYKYLKSLTCMFYTYLIDHSSTIKAGNSVFCNNFSSSCSRIINSIINRSNGHRTCVFSAGLQNKYFIGVIVISRSKSSKLCRSANHYCAIL